MTDNPEFKNATLNFYPKQNAGYRRFALWYFMTLIVIWHVFGQAYLGFEQSWAHPLTTIGTACLAQIFFEWVDAKANRRKPRYAGGIGNFFNLLPPAVIAGAAVGMLLYPNERITPMIFAALATIASKVLIRFRLPNGQTQHVFNPSNFGITITLLLFPDVVGMAPPYHFTENLVGFWHWALPAFILLTGLFLHSVATGRLPLCLAWIGGFVGQALFRAWLGGNPWYVPMMPMSSAAFIIFTLYMIPDPATTPLKPVRQVLFALAVAIVYGALQLAHVVYGLFIALAIVCLVRGVSIHVYSLWLARTASPAPSAVPPMHAPQPAGELAGVR